MAHQLLDKRHQELGSALRVQKRGQQSPRQRSPGQRPLSDLGCWGVPLWVPGMAGPATNLNSRSGKGQHRCSDDLWIEAEKTRQRKLVLAARGSLCRLPRRRPEESEKVRPRNNQRGCWGAPQSPPFSSSSTLPLLLPLSLAFFRFVVPLSFCPVVLLGRNTGTFS